MLSRAVPSLSGRLRDGTLYTRGGHVIDFSTVHECMTVKPDPVNRDEYNGITLEGKSWLGFSTESECMERTANGWPEGWHKVRERLSVLTLPTLPKRRRTRLSDDGPDLNLDRYLDGSDQCWNVRRRVPIPTVNVSVMIGALANVSPEQLFWRGAAALAISDALERAGYRVRLTALSMSKGVFKSDPNGDVVLTRVRLKDYAEPLRPAHIAATVCTPVLFRIGCFRSRCALPVRGTVAGWTLDPVPGTPGVAPIHVPCAVLDRDSAQELITRTAPPRR